MKKTFEELREIDSIVSNLYSKNPSLIQSKFGYAYKMFYKNNFKPTLELYQEELVRLRVEYALEDKKTKEVITDDSPRGFKYDKQSLIELISEEIKLDKKYNLIEIDIKPYISSYIPEELSGYEVELLTGLVI